MSTDIYTIFAIALLSHQEGCDNATGPALASNGVDQSAFGARESFLDEGEELVGELVLSVEDDLSVVVQPLVR